MQDKRFGYFDDDNREYVITDPKTPWPWINYLGNEDFFSLISNTAGGYSFYKDAKFRRITRYRYNNVPMDNGGRYFYINEGGNVWSPTWKPCKTALDSYECRHGMSYTRITGSKDGIEASLLFFVPLKTWGEVQKLTLRNTSAKVRKLKLFSFAEWCLWNAATDMENFQRNFSTGEVEVDGSVIYHKTEYKERLDCEHGIVLNNPPFTRYVVEYGEISTYPAGYKENAGIFCHNNPWVIIGETVLGRGDRSWEYFRKICPSYTEEHSALHKVEPYVCCQMVAGKDAARPGEGKNSWLTGTAAWMWYAITQFILGIKPSYEGLEINPCIPAGWKGFNVKRRFRGAEYHITVKNPDGVCKGIKSVTVDGQPIEGNVVNHLPGTHTVEVIMG